MSEYNYEESDELPWESEEEKQQFKEEFEELKLKMGANHPYIKCCEMIDEFQVKLDELTERINSSFDEEEKRNLNEQYDEIYEAVDYGLRQMEEWNNNILPEGYGQKKNK